MAGTISFGGVGSGIDTEGIVQGLVGASSSGVSSMKSRAAATHAAVSTMSELGTLLANLKSALEALDDPKEVASYAGSSSSSALSVSTLGTANPGRYSVSVDNLAKEQRTYSNAFASASAPLGQSGSFDITVGTDAAVPISVSTGDSLEDIVAKVNASDARVNASIFYDGTSYYMQIAGQETGAANSVGFAENGTSLGLTVPGNTKQNAEDAVVTIDTFTITRPSNEISGVLQGVTLTLSELTTSPATVKVESNPDALKEKLEAVVTAYNAVIDKVQSTAGYADIKPTNPVLAGDALLRGLSNKMSSSLQTLVGSGSYQTLGSIGLSADKSGKLSLDSAKLTKALATDAESVTKMLSGVTENDGAMDVFRDALATYTDTGTGLIDTRKETLESRAKSLDDRVTEEEARLQRYAEMLRRQFTNMDGQVAAWNSQMDYLSRLYSGG
ncbi:MAG: flagellar filament capping protein FliD [Polyangiaceae bacterium]